MISIFNQFSLRFIRNRKGRVLGTVFGIALGIVMIVATAIVSRSITASFKEMITTAAGKAELQVLPSSDGGFGDRYLDEIAKVDGVAGAFPVVTGNTRVVKDSRDVDFLLVYGVDAARDRQVREYDLTSGRFISNRGREVVLPEQWAKEKDYKKDDSITLLTSKGLESFRIVGLISSKGVGTTNNSKFLVTNYKEAQSMFMREGQFDQVDVTLIEGYETGQVMSTLKRALGDRLVIERPSSRGKDVEDSMSSFRFMLSLTGSISLLVGLFIIYNNMEVSVEERRFSIAMMRALGLRRRKIMFLVLSEAALMGVWGGVLGTLFGIWIAKSMGAAITDVTSSASRVILTDMGITPGILGIALAAGPIAAVISSLGPAYKMVKVSPLEALVPVETSWGGHGRAMLASGTFFFVTGLSALIFFIFPSFSRTAMFTNEQFRIFGVAGFGFLVLGNVLLMPTAFKKLLERLESRRVVLRIALDNLARVPGRTSAAVAGIMIALTMMIALSAESMSLNRYITEWIDKAVGWDMLVSSSFYGNQSDVPLNEAVGTKLKKIRGIQSATTLRLTRADFGGTKVGFSAFDTKTAFDFIKFNVLEGDESKIRERMQTGKFVLISSITARRFKLKVNDTMKFLTPDGTVKFPIAAVVKDYAMDTGTVYLDRSTYKRLWGDARIDAYDVLLKQGYSVKEVKRRIERELGKGRHLVIRTHEEFKKNVMSMVDRALALMNLLVYISIFVSAFGIINSALISVWQRKRELSVLRALGAKKHQVRTILFNEAIVIALAGAVVGALTGTLLGKAMVEANHTITGILLEFEMPWRAIAIAFMLAIGLSGLGSLLPWRVANKLKIVDGIRYE